jgi:hypothetical protein
MRAKVRLHDGERRHEETAAADTDDDALREEGVPVCGAEREHHVPEHDAEGADGEEEAQMAAVVDGADDAADRENEEGL